MGESAGGSSIILHMTAFGGLKGPAPFSQAIMQSPGYIPQPRSVQSEDNFNSFLSILNVSTIDEARQLPPSVIIEANSKQIQTLAANSSYLCTLTFDGSIIPAFPGRLLQEGRFDHNVTVMTGHNVGEGLFFADPSVKSNSEFATWLDGVLPNMIPSAINHITNTLYPPIFDGSQGYSNQFERQGAVFADVVFLCNTVFTADAFNSKIHAYEFSVPPGLHTQDLLDFHFCIWREDHSAT
jgi:carboxylesterase type B